MNKERIIELVKEWFEERSGEDYYDYLGDVHWFGNENTLDMFADALMKEIK